MVIRNVRKEVIRIYLNVSKVCAAVIRGLASAVDIAYRPAGLQRGLAENVGVFRGEVTRTEERVAASNYCIHWPCVLHR
jgi:hypothetical protein